MSLLKEERETTINWSEADDKVSIMTTSGPVMTKCNRLGYEVVKKIKAGNGRIIGREYLCPIGSISFRSLERKKRPKRIMTEEQKRVVADRFRIAREARKSL